MDKYYTPEQIAEILLVRPRTVRNWLRDGDLEGKKISNQWRISHENLQDFKSKRKEEAEYTVLEVAKILNVDKAVITKWLVSGKLDGQTVANTWKITKDNLRKMFTEGAFDFICDDEGVLEKDGLLKELYPEVYKKREESRRRPMSALENYGERCQIDLERRFPYPYVGDETIWNDDHTDYMKASDPEAHEWFYGKKHKEETMKLNKLMEALRDKRGASEEDIAEIKRTNDNLNLLKIGQLLWEIHQY